MGLHEAKTCIKWYTMPRVGIINTSWFSVSFTKLPLSYLNVTLFVIILVSVTLDLVLPTFKLNYLGREKKGRDGRICSWTSNMILNREQRIKGKSLKLDKIRKVNLPSHQRTHGPP